MTVSNHYPVQSEQNTTLMETFIAHTKKRNKQLNTIEYDLF